MEFTDFKKAVSAQFDKMAQFSMFASDASKEDLWDTYLNSFPEGSNPIFRERTEHDCNCCKGFIRKVGNILAINDDLELMSIWDINIGGHYQVVADAMSELVKNAGIRSAFFSNERNIGTDSNVESATGIVWNHFHQVLPDKVMSSTSGQLIGESYTNFNGFLRSVTTITTDAIETVEDLIQRNVLYRGQEFQYAINSIKKHKREYDEVAEDKKHLHAWLTSHRLGRHGNFRNTVIGTLLVDLSEGMDLELAVDRYGKKVDPTNYKRPKNLGYSKAKIDAAEKKIVELGLVDSLPRRLAVTEDITINDVLFADRSAKVKMGVFDDLRETISTTIPNVEQAVEISIEDFIATILPETTSMEVAMDNSHITNLMTLVAPAVSDADLLTKWNNNFTWSYNGDVADSLMKETVKGMGGQVEDVALRFSIMWNTPEEPHTSDLDAHCETPNGLIYYANKYVPRTSGKLDVDIMRPSGIAVENIRFSDIDIMPDGDYRMRVNNYHRRSGGGFSAEIEFGGQVYEFHVPGMTKQYVDIATVTKRGYDLSIEFHIKPKSSSRDVWGLKTLQMQKVNLLMTSPNHWEGNSIGNKHWFFIIDKCVNPSSPRGFYNEFLRPELNEHRTVLEILGNKMKPEWSENQLSGLGFSSTLRNEALVKVTGKVNRFFKIKF